MAGDGDGQQMMEEQEEESAAELPLKSAQQIADEVGVSSSTIERVRTILEEGSPEQIESLRNKGQQGGEGPGIRTVFSQVQSDKLKSKLEEQQYAVAVAMAVGDGNGPIHDTRRDNLKLFNKDFRTIDLNDIADESVDLMLVLDFELVLSTLEFHDPIVPQFGLIPERAFASNLVFYNLPLVSFRHNIICILTFKKNPELSGQ